MKDNQLKSFMLSDHAALRQQVVNLYQTGHSIVPNVQTGENLLCHDGMTPGVFDGSDAENVSFLRNTLAGFEPDGHYGCLGDYPVSGPWSDADDAMNALVMVAFGLTPNLNDEREAEEPADPRDGIMAALFGDGPMPDGVEVISAKRSDTDEEVDMTGATSMADIISRLSDAHNKPATEGEWDCAPASQRSTVKMLATIAGFTEAQMKASWQASRADETFVPPEAFTAEGERKQ